MAQRAGQGWAKQVRRLVFSLSMAGLVLGGGAVACIGTAGDKDFPSELEQYAVESTPATMTPLNINYDDKITLIGVEVEGAKEGLKAGDRVRLKMYWRANSRLKEPNWKLFTHVLDSGGKRLLNIDNVGPLRRFRKGDQAWPPGRWEVDKIYVDSQSFSVPRKTKTKTLRVAVGIWNDAKRLKIKGGPSLKQDRGLVATLKVVPPKALPDVPELEVVQLTKGVKLTIDGDLSEPAWKNAADTGAFVNVATGKVATNSPVGGSAKLLWDQEALYVGFTVQDKDLTGGFDAKSTDPHLWTKDCVELMIDPDGNGDNRDYYEIQVSPQNLVFDSRFERYNFPVTKPDGPFGHQKWSAKLQSAVKLRGTLDNPKDQDEGYTVELRIPWSSFGKAKTKPPRRQQAWRINLYAMQSNSGVAWSPILGEGNFHKAPRFGRVRWLTDKSQRLSERRARASAIAESRKRATAKGKVIKGVKKKGTSAKPGTAKNMRPQPKP